MSTKSMHLSLKVSFEYLTAFVCLFFCSHTTNSWNCASVENNYSKRAHHLCKRSLLLKSSYLRKHKVSVIGIYIQECSGVQSFVNKRQQTNQRVQIRNLPDIIHTANPWKQLVRTFVFCLGWFLKFFAEKCSLYLIWVQGGGEANV